MDNNDNKQSDQPEPGLKPGSPATVRTEIPPA
jgi:hypothetical protein